MKISLVAAMDRNRVIGMRGALPWHLPADLRHFKQLTLGKPLLMGRKTWESLPGILPDRAHLVLTRDLEYRADGARVVHRVEDALNEATRLADELMVIGGGEIYRLFLPMADRLYLTEVDTEVKGDAWFPELVAGDWEEMARVHHPADDENDFSVDFVRYGHAADMR